MYIGKVRAARMGEIPTHYATEDIVAGEPLVATDQEPETRVYEVTFDWSQVRCSVPAPKLFGHTPPTSYMAMHGHRHPQVEHVTDMLRKRRAERRHGYFTRWVFGIGAIVFVAAVLYASLAHAATLTYEAPADHFAEVNKMVPATITSYSSSADETDDTPLIMASGEKVYAGAAACPSKYPFGTKVTIEGSTYTCEDRMNARYREQEHFDIWASSKAEAIQYGVHRAAVEVLQ